jgi:hypothetical protein
MFCIKRIKLKTRRYFLFDYLRLSVNFFTTLASSFLKLSIELALKGS